MALKYMPHDYQKRAIEFGVKQGAGGFFLDPGLGKTSVLYAIYKVLKAQNAVTRLLVVAPLRPAYAVWPAEQQKWADFAGMKVAVLHGDHKLERLRGDADVCVINPEGLPWLARQHWGEDCRFDMLVVDESTRFKHPRTQRFKTLVSLLNHFRRRYILTGTPAPNGMLDLFGQIYLLDGGAALGRFITHYRLKYFQNPDGQGWVWRPLPGAVDRIIERISPLTVRMSAEEYLKLPELIINDVPVVLPPPAMKAYLQMEDTLMALVKDDVVLSANASVAFGKCRQLAGGGIYREADRACIVLHDAKLDAAEEIVEELAGKPVIIAYEFDHERIRLQERFPDAPYIGGGVTPKRFKEIENLWNLGAIPVLLAQPQSVAHGLNLQRGGSDLIFYSLTPNLEDYDQIIRRIYRQGQEQKVRVHRLLATGTVDEVIAAMLKKKDTTQKALFTGLLAQRRSQ
jgi:hypothetical protein